MKTKISGPTIFTFLLLILSSNLFAFQFSYDKPSTDMAKELGVTQPLTKVMEGVWKDGSNNYVVLNVPFSPDIIGYTEEIPVYMYITKEGVIKSLVYGDNLETPKYFKLIEDANLLKNWVGKSLKDGKSACSEVEVVTGATYSRDAVVESIKLTIETLIEKSIIK